jgi:hypothetical protein
MQPTVNTTTQKPASRLEFLAALWARQTGRKIVIAGRSSGSPAR